MKLFGHDPLAFCKPKSSRKPRDFEALSEFLHQKICPSIAVTLTFKKNIHGASIGPDVMKSVCRLFLNRVNHKIYGRHAVRRKGFKLGVITALGRGASGDNPHSHMALTSPKKYSIDEFLVIVRKLASSTRGVDQQIHVVECHDHRWVRYGLDTFKHEWVPELTYEAVRPLD